MKIGCEEDLTSKKRTERSRALERLCEIFWRCTTSEPPGGKREAASMAGRVRPLQRSQATANFAVSRVEPWSVDRLTPENFRGEAFCFAPKLQTQPTAEGCVKMGLPGGHTGSPLRRSMGTQQSPRLQERSNFYV